MPVMMTIAQGTAPGLAGPLGAFFFTGLNLGITSHRNNVAFNPASIILIIESAS